MSVWISNILFVFLLALYPTLAISADKVVLPADYKPFYLTNNWKVTPLASYNTEKGNRAIAFIIDKNDDLGISFITYMLSNKPNAWEGCNPFIVNVKSKSKELFFNNEALLNVIASLQTYADILCPYAKQMLIFGSEKPYKVIGIDIPTEGKFDDSIFFTAKITKDDEEKWQISPENIVNTIQPKFSDLNEKLLLIQKEYNVMKLRSTAENIASVHRKKKLDNPAIVHTSAEIMKQAIPFTSLLHIKNNEWVDSPMPLKILNEELLSDEKNGWYLITGKMNILSNKEKMKYGIKIKEKAGNIEIANLYKCKQEKCMEYEDILSVLRDKYDLPDWIPQK